MATGDFKVRVNAPHGKVIFETYQSFQTTTRDINRTYTLSVATRQMTLIIYPRNEEDTIGITNSGHFRDAFGTWSEWVVEDNDSHPNAKQIIVNSNNYGAYENATEPKMAVLDVELFSETNPINLTFGGDFGKYEVIVEKSTNGLDYTPADFTNVKDGITLSLESFAGLSDIRLFFKPIDGYEVYEVDYGNPVSFNPEWRSYQEGLGVAIYLTENTYLYYGNIINFIPSINEVSSNVAPLNKLYLLDANNLELFSDIPRFIEDEQFNISQFILNLISFPFKINSDYHPSNADVYLGIYDTNIKAPLINSEVITVELGEIVVTDLVGSVLDYEQSDFKLILPFTEKVIQLEPKQVVGKVISLSYQLDLYNGDVTVNVYNGDLLPIISESLAVGREIPIRVIETITGGIGGFKGAYNGVYSAYIKWVRPELMQGQFYNLVLKNGVLGDVVSGYVVVENIDLQSRVSLGEKNNIINMLKSGVIIK